MLRLYHKPDDGSVLVSVPIDELTERHASRGWIWLDMDRPTHDEIAAVGQFFEFDRVALEDVVEDTQFPKVDDYESYLFVVLHGLGGSTDRFGTVELDAFVGAEFLVTAHQDQSEAVAWMAEQAQRNPAFSDGGPDRMLARIAEAQGRRFLPLVETLDHRIERLEDRAIIADGSVIPEIQALRRDIVLLRRTVGPQREALLRLSRELSPLVGRRAQLRFGDVYDHLYRLVESLDATRALLASLLDTYRSAVAERMNDVMRVLTVYAAILLPLSLVAGIYGMNFANMPELQWRWGYFVLLAAMGTLAIGQWLYFARRGFIGPPRPRAIPKALRTGLSALAVAPIRTMTGLFGPPRRSEDHP